LGLSTGRGGAEAVARDKSTGVTPVSTCQKQDMHMGGKALGDERGVLNRSSRGKKREKIFNPLMKKRGTTGVLGARRGEARQEKGVLLGKN